MNLIDTNYTPEQAAIMGILSRLEAVEHVVRRLALASDTNGPPPETAREAEPEFPLQFKSVRRNHANQ